MFKYLTPFLFLIVALLLTQCKEEDYSKYQNENYVWFVPNGSSKGEWKKISPDDDAPILTDGFCTTYFPNGSLREEYNVDGNGDVDTTFYYNLDTILTHYSISHEIDIVTNYVFEDGPFEAFDMYGDLAITGTVENHNLINPTLHGMSEEFASHLLLVKKHAHAATKISEILIEGLNDADDKSLPELAPGKSVFIYYTLQSELAFLLKEMAIIKDRSVSKDLKLFQKHSITLAEAKYELLNKNYRQIIELSSESIAIESRQECETILKDGYQNVEHASTPYEKTVLKTFRSLQISDFLAGILLTIEEGWE